MIELPAPGLRILPEQVKVNEENLIDARGSPVLLPAFEAPRIELAGVEQRPQLLVIVCLGQLQFYVGFLTVIKLAVHVQPGYFSLWQFREQLRALYGSSSTNVE